MNINNKIVNHKLKVIYYNFLDVNDLFLVLLLKCFHISTMIFFFRAEVTSLVQENNKIYSPHPSIGATHYSATFLLVKMHNIAKPHPIMMPKTGFTIISNCAAQ